VLGTAFYMSPEQAQSFPDIDGRTDLFSVGAILYEMLTGEPPHSAPTYEAVLIAICTRDAADVRNLAPTVPEKLARVIARALRRDRDERYQSAADMLADLEATQHESRELATKTRTTAGVWLAPPKSQGADRYRTLVFAVVAALGGFAVAAYFVARGSGPSQPTMAVPAGSALGVRAEPAATLPSELPAALAPPLASTATKPALKSTLGKPRETAKPVGKKPAPVASAGVAGSLGLSTREP
jgi:hypothetical protein